MPISRKHWLYAAFLASLLAVGIPYWMIPYAKLNLPNALWQLGLLVPFASAALLRLLRVASITRATLVVTLAIVACVVIRIVFDGMLDASSHNLFPLELVIALLVGAAVGLAGALLGAVLGKLLLKPAA